MTPGSPLLRSALSVLLTLGLTGPDGGAPVAVSADPTSVVRVDGDSTLHRWHLETHDVQVRLALDPAAGEARLTDAIRAHRVTKLEVTVPVGQLSSGDSGLDDTAYDAIHAAAHPSIAYVLGTYRVVSTSADGVVHLEAQGKLTINGVTRDEALALALTPTATGVIVRGTQALTMREFQVEPPVKMLGTLRTADAITISWSIVLTEHAG